MAIDLAAYRRKVNRTWHRISCMAIIIIYFLAVCLALFLVE